jgi:ABC-type polar amino acid transport system ATPase subunit
VIEFRDVHKSFGSLEVLKGINLKIEKGQVVTLIGPSGSGKSTILRCMNLLERPTSGQVLIAGKDITAPKTDIQGIRKNIGMVFQHFNLFPHMTVMEMPRSV